MFEIIDIVIYCTTGVFCYKALELILTLRGIRPTNKKHLILFLKSPRNYSREEIVDLGKKAIHDPVMLDILVNPVVAPNGITYEKAPLQEYLIKKQGYPDGLSI
jgi:hypothetical protein